MKTAHSISIAIGLMLLFGCMPKDRLMSYRADEPLIIDGDLLDWPTNKSEIVITDRAIDQGNIERPLSDNSVVCRSAWDGTFLYLAFEVDDTDLNAQQRDRDHGKLYLDDMVEFLIDTRHDASDLWSSDDIIYHINLLGTIKDDRGTATGEKDVAWNGIAKFALNIEGTINDDSDKDKGYTMEVAIPWSELDVSPESGLLMGFNFANGDNDGQGRQLFDWMSAWPMRTPSQFGIIELENE